jgi:hypothetical protein
MQRLARKVAIDAGAPLVVDGGLMRSYHEQ